MAHFGRPSGAQRVATATMWVSLAAPGLLWPFVSHAQAQVRTQEPPAATGATPTSRPEPRLDIRRFEVEGASLVPAARLAGVLAPLTGPSKRFSDIEAAGVVTRFEGLASRGGHFLHLTANHAV